MSEEKNNIQEDKEEKKRKTTSAKSKEQKKIKELQEKFRKLQEENAQLKDQNIRKIAEFENFRRRTEKEFIAHLEYANEGLIKDLLPAIDDFERFLAHSEEDQNQVSLKEGADLIYKKLIDILSKKGLKEMESLGQEYDPEKHEALVQVESKDHESGFIVDVHLKGYLLNEKVIRHSQVVVSK